MAGYFVARQFLAAVGDQGFRGEIRVLLDHEQRHHFAGIFIRLCDRCDFEHAGMCGGDALDLIRIHIESGYQDHVLFPVLDVDEAGRVHAADVAGSQPVAEHDLVRFVRPVPVAAHDLRPEHANFSDTVHRQFLAVIVANGDVRGRDGQADGAVEIQAGGIRGGDRRGFGESPPLGHDAARHLFPARGHHALQRHAAGESKPQRAEIDFVEFRRVQQRVEQRVHAADEIEFVSFQVGDEGLEIARIGDQHVPGAERQEDEAIGRERKYMIQRQRRDHGIPPAGSKRRVYPRRCLQHVRHHVAMGEHGGLCAAGGASRVLQEGDVLSGQRHRLELLSESASQGPLERRGSGHRPRGNLLAHMAQHEIDDEAARHPEEIADARDQHMFERGTRQHLLQHVRKVLDDDDCFRSGVLQLMLELAGGIEWVGVDDGHARPQHAEQRDWILQDIGHHQGNAIARQQTRFALQPRCECAAQCVELRIGQRRTHVGESGRMSVPCARLIEDVPK